MKELTEHHVGGLLKVAPEHANDDVLDKMRKPSVEDFESFSTKFREESKKAGKKQYIVPYFISSHPGSDVNSMIDLAVFLKRNGYKPDQVQDFIPAPLDVATCMYYTEMDPFTKEPVFIAKKLKDRKTQRALMQFFKPENYFEVRKALLDAGRKELIGNGCDCLIPAKAPKEAIDRRRRMAGKQFRGEYVHRMPDGKSAGESGHGRKKSSKKQGRFAPGSGISSGSKSSPKKRASKLTLNSENLNGRSTANAGKAPFLIETRKRIARREAFGVASNLSGKF
jgi:hypothetical protein